MVVILNHNIIRFQSDFGADVTAGIRGVRSTGTSVAVLAVPHIV